MRILRKIAGCMTGTSIDGLDAALVEVEGSGLEIKVRVLQTISWSFSEMACGLRRLAEQELLRASEITQLSHDLALLHLDALRELIDSDKIDLIVIHGQTIYHAPPLSWQLINPVPVAYGLNVPVMYDLRAADLAHGGQGAPITPLADFVLFRDSSEHRYIVNLGGFCNVTYLPDWNDTSTSKVDLKTWTTGIKGWDVCVCNNLLDRIARDLFNMNFDKDGLNAAQGHIQIQPFTALTSLFDSQSDNRKSLGTGNELWQWLDEYRDKYKPEDIARTACAGIAEIITRPGTYDRIILAGGGVKNKTLYDEIRSRSKVPVDISDSYGIPAPYREAIEMAVLGALCQDRIPITLPQVTGVAGDFVSGCWIKP